MEDSLNARLKKLIELEKLDEKSFADRVNRNLSSVSRYLSDETTPRTDFIIELSRVFPHWSLSYLLAGDGEPIIHPDPSPTTTTHYAETVHYWISKKEHLRRGIEALPDESHQTLHVQANRDLLKLIAELKQLIKRQKQIN